MDVQDSWSQKIQKTVKLKELDEFGTFHKKVILFFYVLVKNSHFPKKI